MNEKMKRNSIEKETIVFERKMTGPWSKVNKELKKQLLNLEEDKDAEVLLKVKPLGFRNLRSEPRLVSETDTATSSSNSEYEKKEDEHFIVVNSGISNDAFEDDESTDFVDSPVAKPFKETHFGGSFRNIDEEIEKRKDRIRLNSQQTDEKNEEKDENQGDELKSFHNSTLMLNAGECSENNEVIDESCKENAIYEELKEPKFDPFLSVRHIEFNNSRESSMI